MRKLYRNDTTTKISARDLGICRCWLLNGIAEEAYLNFEGIRGASIRDGIIESRTKETWINKNQQANTSENKRIPQAKNEWRSCKCENLQKNNPIQKHNGILANMFLSLVNVNYSQNIDKSNSRFGSEQMSRILFFHIHCISFLAPKCISELGK